MLWVPLISHWQEAQEVITSDQPKLQKGYSSCFKPSGYQFMIILTSKRHIATSRGDRECAHFYFFFDDWRCCFWYHLILSKVAALSLIPRHTYLSCCFNSEVAPSLYSRRRFEVVASKPDQGERSLLIKIWGVLILLAMQWAALDCSLTVCK